MLEYRSVQVDEEDTMAVDMMSNRHLNFLADNLLTQDDFNLGSVNFEVEVDPSEFLFDPDEELLQQITEDLEIPMSLDNEENSFHCNNPQVDILENINEIKQEQLTPEPSSDSSFDGWTLHGGDPSVELQLLETPPITPQSSLDGSPPSTPTNQDLSNIVQGLLQTIPSAPILNGMPPTKRPKSILAGADLSNNGTSASQILVLTPEEYAKYSAQPLTSVDIQSDVSNPAIKTHCSATKKNNKNISSSLPSLKRLISLPNYADVKQELDVNAFKRQQRMIKNRESACLSRKKKKEYMANLEGQVRELTISNQHLQQENHELKQLVTKLEDENSELKKRFNLNGLKKATVVLAVIFMFSLNFTPLSNLYTNQHTLSPSNDPSVHHHSRTLLWSATNTNVNGTSWDKENQTNDVSADDAQFMEQTLNSSLLVNTNCSSYFNKTESQRLDRELRGWVFREKENLEKHQMMFMKKKMVPPIPKLRSLIVQESYMDATDYRDTPNNNNELQLYNLASKSHGYFLEAIQRRDDTFYVVSFTGDHLLLPALTHNKTRRPLMSLVLPAISLNETNEPHKDHVTMMQIDCEVTNTKLVQIKESLIRPLKQGAHNETLFSSPPQKEENRKPKKRKIKK